MTEKKFVVDGMKLSYNGPFDIIDFYRQVEDWISAKGLEKEIKKKVEHVEASGKKIEWFLEIWEDVGEYARRIVRLRALFNNVQEVKVQKGKRKKKLNKGEALIIIDGILETDIQGKWQQKPVYYFLRALTDKFIYKFHMNKIEDRLAKDAYDLHHTLEDFFNSYKL